MNSSLAANDSVVSISRLVARLLPMAEKGERRTLDFAAKTTTTTTNGPTTSHDSTQHRKLFDRSVYILSWCLVVD